MTASHRSARINLRLLIILAVAVPVLALGALGVRRWQRERQVAVALAEGNKAYDAGDWNEAAKQLGRYVARRINDLDDPEVVTVCEKYADAQLRVEPLKASNIQQAIATYRRLLRDGEFDPALCDKLAMLYQATSNAAELEYIADQFKANDADDPRWRIWMAQAYAAQRQPDAAKEQLLTVVDALQAAPEANDAYVKSCLMLASLPAQSEDDWVKKWLDRAILYDPTSAEALAIRARYYRDQSERLDVVEGQRQAYMESAMEDLKQAEAIDDATPASRLLLCAELRAHNALDRAKAQAAAAAKIPDDVVRETYVDITDWRIDLALESISNALANNMPSDAAQQAQAVLEELTETRHRVRVLPVDVELAAATGDLKRAKQSLNDYLDVTPADNPLNAPSRAYLAALVADAEGDPYAVVNLLDPLRDDVRFSGRMQSLLADAYRATGQGGRVSTLFERAPIVRANTLSSALVGVSAMINRGELGAAQREIDQLLQRFPGNLALQLLRTDAVLALARRQTGDRAAALRTQSETTLQSLIEQHPENLDARVRLASLYMETNRDAAAERVFVQAAQDCTDTPDAAMALAAYRQRRQQTSEAQQILEDAVAQWPDQSGPLLALGRFLDRQGNGQAAIRKVSQAVDGLNDDHDKAGVVRWLASIELRDDSTRDAGVARLKSLVASDEQDVLARLMLLQVPELRNDPKTAAQLVSEIKKTEGEAGLRWRLAQARLEIEPALEGGMPSAETQERIETLLTECIEGDPTWASPVVELGRFFEAIQRPERAEQIYHRSLDARPQTAVAERLFLLLQRQRRTEDAAAVLSRYAQLLQEPRHDDWRLVVAAMTGDIRQSSEVIEQRYRQNPNDADTLLLYALISYGATRDADGALEFIKRARANGADPVAATRAEVRIQRAEGRVDDAHATLDTLVQDADSADARALRAAFLASIGNTGLAEDDFKKLPELEDTAHGYVLLCEFYATQNRLSDAIASAQTGLEQYPDALALKRGLLKALLVRKQQGDLDKAAAVLATIDDDDRDTELLWISAGLAQTRGGNAAEVEVRETLRQAAEYPRAGVEAFRGLIAMAMRLKEFEVAKTLLRAAAEQHGDANPNLLTMQARLALEQNDPAIAVAALREAVQRQPLDLETAQLLMAVAPRVSDRSQLEPFVAPLDDAVAAEPNNEQLVLARAGLLQVLEQYDEAIEGLGEFADRPDTGERPSVLLAMAALHQSKGDFVSAGRLIGQVETRFQNPPAARRARLQWLAAQKRYDKIREFAETHVTPESLKDDEDRTIALAAVQALADSGNADHTAAAIRLFAALADTSPQFVPARMGLALAYVNRQRLDDAISVYRDVLDIDPNTHVALNNLAWLLATHQRNYSEARKFAERAVQLSGDNVDYHDTLAEICLNLPDAVDVARAEFLTCAQLSPARSAAQARAYLKLAKVCVRMERFDEAERYLSLCKQIDSDGSAPLLTDAERAEVKRLEKTIEDR